VSRPAWLLVWVSGSVGLSGQVLLPADLLRNGSLAQVDNIQIHGSVVQVDNIEIQGSLAQVDSIEIEDTDEIYPGVE